MTNGLRMDQDQFEELSLESKLNALFKKAVQNGENLESILSMCHCREESCRKKFDELGSKVKTKVVVERAIATVVGSASGFISGFFGGHLK